jgi:hypothetical protein
MTVTFKDLKKKKNQLGQFMTPDTISTDMVNNTIYTGLIIEPSFGEGSFLYKLEKKYSNTIGIEYDPDLYNQYTGHSKIYNQSFYTFHLPDDIKFDNITFVGNPPYRTPAFSLTSDDSDTVKRLGKKYKLKGVKEEAVFFLAYAIELIENANVTGMIHWVLPKTIFENNSAAFTNFRKFISKHAPLVEIIDISEAYPDVAQPLCIAKFLVNQRVSKNITDSLVMDDTIDFRNIFKKTYLGSVPCESIFLSCKDEPLESFMSRMEDIFQKNVSLEIGLSYKGKYHLRALNGSNAVEKFNILNKYVAEIKTKISLSEFSNIENYKPITHRTENRFYFRNKSLTTSSFIYIINSNPTRSFYFPGNPTKTSTDYFGFCDYDCNRNCSPGANRTVPLENISENITDEFKNFWESNTSEPISEVFNYLLYVSKSQWYKTYKANHQRFYFGIPRKFDKNWRPNSNKNLEIEFTNNFNNLFKVEG